MVEESADAAVGGDDGELAAPHGDGFGDAVQEALVRVKGEFVEGDVAALAGESVGVGGKGIDAAAVGELEDVGGRVGVAVEDDFAERFGAEMKDFSPIDAIFKLEAGLEEVFGGDIGVEASVPSADQQDEPEGIGEGEADLAGFDGDFERGVVLDPIDL